MDGRPQDIIQVAIREFQEFIDQVAQDGTKVLESRGAVGRLGKVNLRLQQVSKFLAAHSRPSPQTPEAAYEFLKYREILKTLRGTMQTLQFSLLAEKARLENVRANMKAACAWATSLREIS